jgi:chaperone required for assembly of F1-ATPase
MAMNPSNFSVKPEAHGYGIFRDNKVLETPAHHPFIVPTRTLAEAVAEEFSSQGQKMDLRKMPITQLALTAIDVSGPKRAEIIDAIMRLGESELLCQRASDPPDLVAEENRVWQPYLAWCKQRYKADLCTGSGIIPFDQNPQALAALRACLDTLDAFTLAGLSEACHSLGSLVLGLALLDGRADAASAFEAAELDHLWQSRKWGDDPVSEARLGAVMSDLDTCARWFALTKA